MTNNIHAGVETAVSASSTTSSALQLLQAVWPNNERVHQLAFRDKKSGKFWNEQVTDVNTAVALAAKKSATGIDVYFATAGYLTGDNRLASNVAGSYEFHLDVDCGEDKAATGYGYKTFDFARAAVRQFYQAANLPAPTHVVLSGSGLHVYWALEKELMRTEWQALAKKLKLIGKTHKLLADDCRTGDIASILRVPGTFNYKAEEPARVELLESSETAIETETMVASINAEYNRLTSLFSAVEITSAKAEGPEQHVSNDGEQQQPMPAAPVANDIDIEPPNFAQLTSALMGLDPDCDEYAWIFHRIAPMANTAAGIPEIADRLYQLTKEWSSGELRGVPSKKWHTPGGNGLTGKQYFDRVWIRFLKGKYVGKKTTLATIFFHAKQAGWVWNYRDAANGDDGKADEL